MTDNRLGDAMLRVAEQLGKTEGQMNDFVRSLTRSWSADEVIRATYMAAGGDAQVNVEPGVAYALAQKSPAPYKAWTAAAKLQARHGGKIPLHLFSEVLVTEGVKSLSRSR